MADFSTNDPLLRLAAQFQQRGNLPEAERICRELLGRQPKNPAALHLLGIIAFQTGRLDLAIELMRLGIALTPNVPDFHVNLASALRGKGLLKEAVAEYRRALELNPFEPITHNNLGTALHDLGLLDDAEASLRRAIELKPGYVSAQSNLGVILSQKGQLDDAIESYRQALRLKPDSAGTHSSLVYALHFHAGYDARMIFEEHQRWNDLHGKPLAKSLAKLITPHSNNRDPDRPLRIGYVSPDFRNHSVGRFLIPLFGCHDRERFVVHCYSDVANPDAVTQILRAGAREWRHTVGMPDDRLAQLIRDDQIDILVDLTMHMAGNRMLLFARKPAPVQATYLAYCSTTGLTAMDYRLTDPYLDPPGMNDQFYSEKSIRLPETYWCYPVNEKVEEPVAPPLLGNGRVTFGCLNNFCKVSDPALEIWAQLLEATPNSRLILHAPEGSHRNRVQLFLQQRGIDRSRLQFAGKISMLNYLRSYEQIDIALDPFPCNGGTTTCDALWMGVPVVTLAGQTAVGRAGVSLLTNVGLPELIARTPDEYVQIARNLAAGVPRLADLRQTLRQRMRGSPLMDAPRFACNMEAAYRQMWRNWCAQI